MKGIAVLGSTGSIGINSLDVISGLTDKFKVIALAADSNIDLLARQARQFRPKIISVGSEIAALAIRKRVSRAMEIVIGRDGLEEIVSRPDVGKVVFAISGTACLVPLVEAIKKKKEIALANKESLVSAGQIVMRLAKKNGVKIIPIDSEHSAIFQCLEGGRQFLSKIYLTGSGGPLLYIKKSRFNSLPRKFVLNHPKWKMGRKISVDSATMMNKGLEIIEAKYLFDIDDKFIEVLVHPEAIIHSMVEMVDGTVLAQLAAADMRIPIQYALTYPARVKLIDSAKRLDFSEASQLTFVKPDIKKFPCLELARRALRDGASAPAVLNVANEEAVKRYLDGEINFMDIPRLIEKVLSRHKNCKAKEPAVSDILSAEQWARQEVGSLCYH